ncbi:MAG TPA: inositol monophosphatase family protein [Vitreimonas sp.]|jgi:myo-inositol-1(or 4)-monophosphatase|nr:inositol monophosphatase family protein [Vitreimonas sp.]
MSPLLTAMIDAARAAGEGLMRRRARLKELRIDDKGCGDFVSVADLEAEETIGKALSAFAPQYGFLGEEGGRSGGRDELTWIVDPLDGTTNFLWGAPLFGMSLALARGNDVLAAVIHLPALNEMYWCEKGSGTFLNGEAIRVSDRTQLTQSVIAIGIPFAGKPGHPRFHAELRRLTEHTMGIRRTGAGSVDMSFVASGRFDAYFERVVAPWDLAAGAALIMEAGGVAKTADGGALDLYGNTLCAGPAPLVDALIEESRKAGEDLAAKEGRA